MKMQYLRSGGFLLLLRKKNSNRLLIAPKFYNGLLGSFLEQNESLMDFVPFSSTAMGKTAATIGFAERGERERERAWNCRNLINFQSPFQPAMMSKTDSTVSLSARSFASKASKSEGQKQSKAPFEQAHKDVSTVEDSFDASYNVFILVGLGMELLLLQLLQFSMKYFNQNSIKFLGRLWKGFKMLAKARIGSPITSYGQKVGIGLLASIANRIWTQDDIVHVAVNFCIHGPHGAGKVYAVMFKDEADKQRKFLSLEVELT